MKIHVILKSIIPICILSVILLSSCLDRDENNYREQELSEIKQYVEGKGFTHIGYDIYLKFHNRDGIDIQENNVTNQDYFVINYDGVYLDESIWETTDSAKGAVLFPGRYYIYGPLQLRSGEIRPFAFDTAIKYFSAGDSGTIVAPSWYTFGDYSRAFHVGMKQVIKNDTANELEKFNEFFDRNNFSAENVLYEGVYWKNPSNPDYELSDTIIHNNSPMAKIELTGRYAETYYSSGLGRLFYPLTSVGDTLEMHIEIGGNNKFPFIPAIDSALMKMNVGDELELLGGSAVGWGANGYYHPYLNVPVVPEYMPVHYKVKLIDILEITK